MCPDIPRFIVDRMLGRLARWLRMLGYDALYPDVGPDGELEWLARSQDRILLTRDTALAGKKGIRVLPVESVEPGEQLRQVVRDLALELKDEPLSRCSACNGALREASRAEVRDRVPEHIYYAHSRFAECEGCGRTFWRGTHWQNMLHELGMMREGAGGGRNGGCTIPSK